jgi:hypothetical protein
MIACLGVLAFAVPARAAAVTLVIWKAAVFD